MSYDELNSVIQREKHVLTMVYCHFLRNAMVFVFELVVNCYAVMETVGAGFDELLEHQHETAPQLDELFEYFGRTYVGRKQRVGRRAKPEFPPGIWNMRDRVLQKLPRTNNNVECWHNAFDNSVTAQRPVISKFIEMTRKEENITQFKLAQSAVGKSSSLGRRKYRQINVQLFNLVQKYREGETNTLDFLRSIAYNIH
jgi:hypothetical protein